MKFLQVSSNLGIFGNKARPKQWDYIPRSTPHDYNILLLKRGMIFDHLRLTEWIVLNLY